MASNAVLSEQRPYTAASVRRAHLAIDLARPSRPVVVTDTDDGEVIDLKLRAGVRVNYKSDGKSDVAGSLFALADTIKSIEGLPPGWDSYGAHPLNDAAVLPCVELAIAGVQRCQVPTILPLPTGGLGLRWSHVERELEIDIGPDGLCTAFFEDGETGDEEEVDEPARASELLSLIHRLCQIA